MTRGVTRARLEDFDPRHGPGTSSRGPGARRRRNPGRFRLNPRVRPYPSARVTQSPAWPGITQTAASRLARGARQADEVAACEQSSSCPPGPGLTRAAALSQTRLRHRPREFLRSRRCCCSRARPGRWHRAPEVSQSGRRRSGLDGGARKHAAGKAPGISEGLVPRRLLPPDPVRKPVRFKVGGTRKSAPVARFHGRGRRLGSPPPVPRNRSTSRTLRS